MVTEFCDHFSLMFFSDCGILVKKAVSAEAFRTLPQGACTSCVCCAALFLCADTKWNNIYRKLICVLRLVFCLRSESMVSSLLCACSFRLSLLLWQAYSLSDERTKASIPLHVDMKINRVYLHALSLMRFMKDWPDANVVDQRQCFYSANDSAVF